MRKVLKDEFPPVTRNVVSSNGQKKKKKKSRHGICHSNPNY